MRLLFFVLLFSICLNSSAQFSKHIDEDGNITYVDDPDYDEVRSELDDLSEIQEYLRQRHAARKQQQAKRRTKNSIGLSRWRVDLNRRLNDRKCRDLKRFGLRCY